MGLSRTQQWLKEMLYGFTCGHSCMRVFGVHPVAGLNYSASRLFFSPVWRVLIPKSLCLCLYRSTTGPNVDQEHLLLYTSANVIR